MLFTVQVEISVAWLLSFGCFRIKKSQNEEIVDYLFCAWVQKIGKFVQFTSRPPGCFDAFAKIFLSWNYYNCASNLSNRTVHFDCFTLLRVLYFNYMYCVYMDAWKLKYKKKFNQYKNAGAPYCRYAEYWRGVKFRVKVLRQKVSRFCLAKYLLSKS